MLTESMVRTRACEQPRATRRLGLALPARRPGLAVPAGRLGLAVPAGSAGNWPCLRGGQISRRLREDAGKILTEIRWILESDRHSENPVAGVGPVAVQLVPPEAEG